MKKVLMLTIIVVAVLAASFSLLNAYIYNEKQEDLSDVQSYRGTLTGEVVCLPHRDTTGPQTLECAFGMRTEAGEYYALDLMLMSQEHPPLNTGDRFTANGVITPLELLSSDHWQKYDVKGIFSVTDSLEVE